MSATMTESANRALKEKIDVTGRKMFVFLVNVGQHVGYNQDGEKKIWFQGQRCKTPTHCTKRFGTEKFTRLSDDESYDNGQDLEIGPVLDDINADDEFQQRPQSNLWLPPHARTPQSHQEELQLKQEENALQKVEGGIDSSADATLMAMSVNELQKLAAEEEISLQGCKNKGEMINKINQATGDRAKAIRTGE